MTGIGTSRRRRAVFDGYTLLPRSLEDLTPAILADFDLPEVISAGGAPVFVENESQNADAYNGRLATETSTTKNPELTYTGGNEYTIYDVTEQFIFRLFRQTVATISTELENAVHGLIPLEMELFPNPARMWCAAHEQPSNYIYMMCREGWWILGNGLKPSNAGCFQVAPRLVHVALHHG